jgi:hypothetical protein
MDNFFEEVNRIVGILGKAHKGNVIRQIENAKLMGGTLGETFDIICSLLKTYEISNPELFDLIRKPAFELFEYAKSLGREPLANFDLAEELDKK